MHNCCITLFQSSLCLMVIFSDVVNLIYLYQPPGNDRLKRAGKGENLTGGAVRIG